MNTVMPAQELRKIFDRITREVTVDAVGIRLAEGGGGPVKDLYTVHIGFTRGFHSSLSLRADRGMFTRLTQAILQQEEITVQDMEDVTKEYFNVLCGHFAKVLYEQTRIVSRFDVPFFCRGSFTPRGQREQFSINYIDGRRDAAQLVHYIPDPSAGACPAEGTMTGAPATQKGVDAR